MQQFLLAALVSIALLGGPASAATVGGMLFVRETGGVATLNRIGFDGTTFGDGATVLATIFPTWDAMSYDAAGKKLFFVRTSGGENTLNVIGFDGTTFGDGATVLATIFPTWNAMGLHYTPGPTPIPLPGGLPLLAGAFALLALFRRSSRS